MQNLSTLTDLSIEANWKMIMGCEIQSNVYTEILQLIRYYQNLPSVLCDKMLDFWKHPNAGVLIGEELCVAGARHVTLFLYHGIESLNLSFAEDNFNMRFLMNFNRKKLTNLKELTLPIYHPLTPDRCKRLCNVLRKNLPSLQRLKTRTSIMSTAFYYIANLPLVELHMVLDLPAEAVEFLCNDRSKLRHTLKVLKAFHISNECCCLLAKSMPQLEMVFSETASWLSLLVKDLGVVELNLQSLQFRSSDVAFRNDILELATTVCPKLKEIKVFVNPFRQKIMWFLSKFKELAKLDITIFNQDRTNPTGNEPPLSYDVCLDEFSFPKLLALTLFDDTDQFIYSGYLFKLLAISPNLEKLEFKHCDAFSNKLAKDLSIFMKYKKLKRLSVESCARLHPSGVEYLLEIPTLEKLEVQLFVNRLTKPSLEFLKEKIRSSNLRMKVILSIMEQQY